ncbi:MAG: hypothetical protein EBR01_00195 [Proteobacteria bacterium]|nr:hypothetical protein [Pseudomonadota bacterium]NBY19457.1 hypothetical protein [bacterium]
MIYDSKIALLGGAIDYAGTFPPAALSLDQALARAAKWRQEGKHPWLMNKMVLPVADIKKLTSEMLYKLGANGSPWLFAALGTPCQSEQASEFYKTVEWDLRELRRCREKWYYSSCRQEVISYETKLPNTVFAGPGAVKIYDFVSPVLERAASLTSNEIRDFFFEVPFDGDWRVNIENASQALSDWLDENDELDLIPGIKFRTGGAFVPSAEQLAFGVSKVTGHGLRFKATQGLHHAVTHGKDFGFVNLFAAINFSQGYGNVDFGLKQVEACLSDSHSKNFEFHQNKLSWKEFSMTVEEIETSRRSHGAAFGSCSLDEPDEDLLKEFP